MRKKLELPEEEIVKIYLAGETTKNLGEKYNVSIVSIRKMLNRHGVVLPYGNKKYFVNENYFDEINNEHKAYWLGFLLADGSTSGNNALSLSLQYQDKILIESFLKDIESNHPIGFVNKGTNGISRLYLGNRHMVRALQEKGIVANNKKFYQLPEELERHYWRGAIDGDGTFGYCKYLQIQLVGTQETCDMFKKFCLKFIKTNAKVSKFRDRNLHLFQIHGNIAVQLCKVLYDNSTICLERKKEKYTDFLKNRLPTKQYVPLLATSKNIAFSGEMC